MRSGQVSTDESSVQIIENSWAFSGAFPRWNSKQKCLYWADTLAPAFHRLDDHGSQLVVRLDAPITGLALLNDGMLVSHRNGWSLISLEGNECPLADWPGKVLLGISRHPNGTLWGYLGSGSGCRIGELSAGELREQRQIQEPIAAMCWDASGEHLYAGAPHNGTIYLLSKSSQMVRRLATLPKCAGEIGGLAIDAFSGIWASLSGRWGLVRFSEDGTQDQMAGLTGPSSTDICFCGDEDSTLFVTSARHHLSKDVPANAPSSGSLMRFKYMPTD